MARTVTRNLDAQIQLTPEIIAAAFCEMDDEAQADFFIQCAKIAAAWTGTNGAWWQWDRVGRHLRDCECSKARAMVAAIVEGMA